MAKKITQQQLNRMAIRGAKVRRRSSPVPSAAEVAESESRAPVRPSPELASPSLPVDGSLGNIIRATESLVKEVADHSRRPPPPPPPAPAPIVDNALPMAKIATVEKSIDLRIGELAEDTRRNVAGLGEQIARTFF